MRLLIALSVALLFLPLAGTAQVIHGCVKNNGSLRIVASSSSCSGNETPLSWNAQGPQGVPGADGEPGAQGPPGPVLRVFDALGNNLGLNVGTTMFTASGVGADSNVDIKLASGFTIPLTTALTRFFDPNAPGTIKSVSYPVLFTDLGCQGEMVAENIPAVAGYVGRVKDNAPLLIAVRDEPLELRSVKSFLSNGGTCRTLTAPRNVRAPVVDFISESDLGISFPVAVPVRIAPAPE
jgi:hypothetical protein